MSIVSGFSFFLKKIANSGVREGLNSHQRRRVILINIMCLTGILAYLLLLVINLIKQTPLTFLITNFLAQGIFCFTIFLNHKQRYRQAALFCSSVFLIYINTLAILYGKEGGLDLINLLLCASPVVFFDDKRTIGFFSGLSLCCFFGCRYVYSIHASFVQYGNLDVLFLVNMGVLFACVFLMFIFFKDEIMKFSVVVEKQNAELAAKNSEINESIRYARRIQNTLLKFEDEIKAELPQSFILYLPRDIVSGDFYWFAKRNGKIYGACADCTGHGIPGAFMSMIGMTLLNEIINKGVDEKAGEILDHLNEGIIRMMKQTGLSGENKDGMDIAFSVYDPVKNTLEFAGANLALLLVRNGEMKEYKGDKQPIGIHATDSKPFTTESLVLEKNDVLYFSTDGFADQFGGPRGKKIKRKELRNMLQSVSHLPMKEQGEKMNEKFSDWKGDLAQVDDVLVIGVRF